MKQPRTKIAASIADKTLHGADPKLYGKEIAAYLLSERRTNELSSLMRDVRAAWTAAGHVEVIVSSAHQLSPAVKTDITKLINRLYPQAERIILTETLDPALIGGVRLSLANRQADLSIEAKLHRFKQLTTAGKD